MLNSIQVAKLNNEKITFIIGTLLGLKGKEVKSFCGPATVMMSS